MSVPQLTMTATRRTLVLVLAAALSAVGGVLILHSHGNPLPPPFPLPLLLLVPLYVVALHLSLDFEIRGQSHSVNLSQLPLALGVVFVPPGMHLVARILGSLFDSVLLRRQSPTKTSFNVAVGVLEVGTAAIIVDRMPPQSTPGPRLWLALILALLLTEICGHLAVTAVMRLMGLRFTREQLVAPTLFSATATATFGGVSVVSVAAVWTDPWTLAVICLLGCALTAGYRQHRRLAAQQQKTRELYEFVKGLGPVDVDQPELTEVLDQMRVLLQGQHLDLAISEAAGQGWRHFVSWQPFTGEDGTAESRYNEVAVGGQLGLAHMTATRRNTMATPILGGTGLQGVLTVTGRSGFARGFGMNDMLLLETLATELATSLERGRLLSGLARAASTDPLTSLPNLRDTTFRLDRMIEQAPGTLYIAAVAVESFREVNDTLGHQVGDDLLREVARRLSAAAPHGLVGRIGGGRFAVAVPADESLGGPDLFGLTLRSGVEGMAQVGAVGTDIRLAVGVAASPEHGTDASTLLRRAETAMSSARHVHGGPVLWEPAYEVNGQRRLAVVTALREALASGSVGLAYQPKLRARDLRVTGVEALARWSHPALGAIHPDEFIPLAEAAGLMGALTTTVLRQALSACHTWQSRSPGVGVAVNVSADTLLDQAFVTEVAQVLAECTVTASLLTLELTEGVVLADPELAVERMAELRALGVRISVDDFGTGYSSLTYLKGLPVDEVKVDKGFVSALAEDPADQAVVRAVVDIAHTLGVRVVAEGVETEEQQAALASLGVDEVQGYLHARPMPGAAVSQWLERRAGARR